MKKSVKFNRMIHLKMDGESKFGSSPFNQGATIFRFFLRFLTSGMIKNRPRMWFQIFFIFTPIWGRFPFWLYFSNGLKPPTSLGFLLCKLLGIRTPTSRRRRLQRDGSSQGIKQTEIQVVVPSRCASFLVHYHIKLLMLLKLRKTIGKQTKNNVDGSTHASSMQAASPPHS